MRLAGQFSLGHPRPEAYFQKSVDELKRQANDTEEWWLQLPIL